MKPRNGPEYLADVRGRLLAIVSESGPRGVNLREASEGVRMSMSGAHWHMRALMDSRDVVTIGAGNRIRYCTPQAAAELGALDPRDRECREVVVEGRAHVLSRMAVRSVFDLGASCG